MKFVFYKYQPTAQLQLQLQAAWLLAFAALLFSSALVGNHHALGRDTML